MLIDENARASRCSPLWYATNERWCSMRSSLLHASYATSMMHTSVTTVYGGAQPRGRDGRWGEEKERKKGGGGRGTTHGFVPKMGGERADASSFFAWFVHAQHRPRAPCLFAVPSPSLLPSCPLLPAYSILNDFSTWQAMIGLETLRISRKTACFSLIIRWNESRGWDWNIV